MALTELLAEPTTLAVVVVASGLAGFVDAVVGGGGLILMPSLFAAFPGWPAIWLLGSNKAAAIVGTCVSATAYARRVSLFRQALAVAVPCALVGSVAGATLVSTIPSTWLRQLLPGLLLLILIYTLVKKDMGSRHQPLTNAKTLARRMALIAFVIGAYDGFFGPGTGSFLVFLLVRFVGFDFVHASAHAKWLNVASNLSALMLFSAKGAVVWPLAAMLAVSNVAGSWLGAHMALKGGVRFVRGLFVGVVFLLIVKSALDAYR